MLSSTECLHFEQGSCKLEGSTNDTTVSTPAVYSFTAPPSRSASPTSDGGAALTRSRPSRYRKFNLKTLRRPSYVAHENGADALDDAKISYDKQSSEYPGVERSPTSMTFERPSRKSKARKKSIKSLKDFMGDRLRHGSGGAAATVHPGERRPKSTARFTIYGEGTHTPVSTSGSTIHLRPSTTMGGSTRSGTATSTSKNSCSGESDLTFSTGNTSSNSSFYRGVAAASSRTGKSGNLNDPYHLLDGDLSERHVSSSRQSRIPLREKKANVTSHPHIRARSQCSSRAASPLPNLSLEQKLEMATFNQFPSANQPASSLDSSKKTRAHGPSSSNSGLSRSHSTSPLSTPHSRAGSFETRNSRPTRPRLTPIHPNRLGSPKLSSYPNYPPTPTCTPATVTTFPPISPRYPASVASPTLQSPVSPPPYVQNPLCDKENTPPACAETETRDQTDKQTRKPDFESSDEPGGGSMPPSCVPHQTTRTHAQDQGFRRRSCVVAAGSGLGATAIDEDVPEGGSNEPPSQGVPFNDVQKSSNSSSGGPIPQSRMSNSTRLRELLLSQSSLSSSSSSSNDRPSRRSSVPSPSLLPRFSTHRPTEPAMASPRQKVSRSSSFPVMEMANSDSDREEKTKSRSSKADMTISKSKVSTLLQADDDGEAHQTDVANDAVAEKEGAAVTAGLGLPEEEVGKHDEHRQQPQPTSSTTRNKGRGYVSGKSKQNHDKSLVKRVWAKVKTQTRWR